MDSIVSIALTYGLMYSVYRLGEAMKLTMGKAKALMYLALLLVSVFLWLAFGRG